MNETSLTNDLSGRIEGYGDLLDENGIFDAEYRARRFDTEYERSIGTGVSKQVLLHGYRDQESRVRQLDALAELQRKIPERVETGHALVVSANVLTLAIMSSHLFMHRWIVEEAQTLDDAVMTLRKQVDNARSSGYRVSGHEDPKSSPARRGTKVKVKCDDTTNVTSNSEDVMGLDATHDHVAAVAGERAAVHRPPADMAGSFFSGRHKRCGMGRPAPPEMLARLVIVDTFTHEPFYEIAEHLRQIDREYNIGLVIILLMYESFADRAPGMVVLPQHTTSPSEAYNFGFDLVLRRCCDHNTIAFLNELFVSAAGRCRTDIRRQLLMGNFNVIKELLESTARVSPGLRHEMTDLDDSFGANAEFGEPNTFAGKVSHDASSVLSETTGSFMATVDAIKEHKYSSVLMRMGFSKDTVAELMNPSNKVKYIGRRRMQSGNVKKRTFSAHGNLNSTLGGLSMADDDDTYEEIIMDEMQEVESAVVSAYRDEVARLILDRDRKERAIDFLKDENEKLHRFLQSHRPETPRDAVSSFSEGYENDGGVFLQKEQQIHILKKRLLEATKMRSENDIADKAGVHNWGQVNGRRRARAPAASASPKAYESASSSPKGSGGSLAHVQMLEALITSFHDRDANETVDGSIGPCASSPTPSRAAICDGFAEIRKDVLILEALVTQELRECEETGKLRCQHMLDKISRISEQISDVFDKLILFPPAISPCEESAGSKSHVPRKEKRQRVKGPAATGASSSSPTLVGSASSANHSKNLGSFYASPVRRGRKGGHGEAARKQQQPHQQSEGSSEGSPMMKESIGFDDHFEKRKSRGTVNNASEASSNNAKNGDIFYNHEKTNVERTKKPPSSSFHSQILPRSPSLSGSTRKLMDTGHKTGTPCDEKSSGTSGSPLFDVGESGIIQRQASADKTLSSYNSLGVSALRFDLAPEAPPVTEVSVASCHTTKSLTTKSVSSPILAKQLTGQDVSTSAWKARQHDPPLVERKGSFSSSSGSSVPYASSAFTASPDCKKQTQLRRDMAPLPLDSSPLERERRVQQVEQLQFSMQSTSCSPHRAVVSGDRVQHCETGVAVSEYSGLLDGTYMGTHSALVCFLQALRETYSQLEHVIREELVPLESRIASEISEKNQGANKGDGLQISAELLMHLDATLLLRLASRLRSSCAAVPDVASGNLSDNALSYIGNFPGDPTPPLRTGPSSASEGARDGDVVSTSLRERNTDSSLGLSAKDVTRLLVELNVEEEEVPKTLMNILATADDEEQFFDYETTSRVISELARLEETKKQRIDRTMKRLEERREQMKRELGLGDAGPVRNDPVNHSDTENKTTANMVTKSAQQVALLNRFNMLKSKRPVASDINNPLLHVIKNRAQTVISTTAMHIVAPELSMRCIDMTSSQPFGASDMALVDGLPPVQIRGLSLEQQRKLRGLMKKHPQEILNANIPELQVRSYFATQDKQEVPSPTEIEVPTEVPSRPREVVLSPIELAKRLLFYRTVLQNRSMEEESLERLRIQPHFSLPIFPKACPRAEKGYRDSPLPGVVDNPVEYTSWLYNVPNLELRPTLSYATGGDMSVVFVPKESDHDMTPRTAVGWSRRMEYIFPRRMLARMDMYSSPATLAAQRLGEQLQLTMSDLRTGVVGRPMTLFTSRATQPRSPLSPLKKAQYQGVEPPSIGDDVEAQSARSSSAHELQDTLPWT